MNVRIFEVNTAEGCEWSSDGSLLGLVDPAGGVTVHLGNTAILTRRRDLAVASVDTPGMSLYCT